MIEPSLSAPLPPEWYWNPDIFERERRDIFFKSWIFAGFKSQLANPNDYISFTISGLPVVVRNMKGELVAFRNVCSHRHSIIHPEGCGNAMFRCPYHGWTYDADGVPIGVPDNARSFCFDKEQKHELVLDPLAVDCCGSYVFVRVAKEGPSLKQWLGSFAEPLEHISQTLTTVYYTIDERWDCNWKNRLEVIVEGYHVPVVHKTSMSKQVDGIVVADENQVDPAVLEGDITVAPESGAAAGRDEYSGPHSANFAPLRGPVQHHLDSIAKRLRLATSPRLRGYDHFMLFPNMMFGVNGGVNMCVERYEPISPEQTRIQCWLLLGAMEKPELRDGVIWKTFTQQWIDWTEKVLGEDRLPCELTQKGVHYAPRRALLGKVEARVRHFQNAVHDRLEREESKIAAA